MVTLAQTIPAMPVRDVAAAVDFTATDSASKCCTTTEALPCLAATTLSYTSGRE